MINPRMAKDLVGIAGFVTMLSGLAGWDWRLAATVGGGLLLLGAVVGIVRGR